MKGKRHTAEEIIKKLREAAGIIAGVVSECPLVSVVVLDAVGGKVTLRPAARFILKSLFDIRATIKVGSLAGRSG